MRSRTVEIRNIFAVYVFRKEFYEIKSLIYSFKLVFSFMFIRDVRLG